MLRFIQFFLILNLSLSLIGCASKAAAIPAKDLLIQSDATPADACQQWRQMYDELSEEDKKSLQVEGIGFQNENPYILSEDLVKDCGLRVKIGRFIWDGMREEVSEESQQFAKENSKEIVRVLRHIWDSENFSTDGVSTEKYDLLMNGRGITDEAITPFVGELLKKEGLTPENLDSGLPYVLFTRPMPSLQPNILEVLKQSEKNKNYIEQFLALILLHRESPKTEYIKKLKKIAESPKLSSKAQSKALKIIDKLEAKAELTYNEIEDAENAMYLDLTEPASYPSNK
jgi:hypothetical protein